MKKIMILGSPGSGKSTLARNISQKTGIKALHLDTFYFKPGWVIREKEDYLGSVAEALKSDSWITDGNYSETFDLRLKEADTLILLEFPMILCLWRVIKRSVLGYGKTRMDMAEGCPERLDWEFLKYVWNYEKKKAPRLRKLLDSLKYEKDVYHLKSNTEITTFLATIPKLILQAN